MGAGDTAEAVAGARRRGRTTGAAGPDPDSARLGGQRPGEILPGAPADRGDLAGDLPTRGHLVLSDDDEGPAAPLVAGRADGGNGASERGESRRVERVGLEGRQGGELVDPRPRLGDLTMRVVEARGLDAARLVERGDPVLGGGVGAGGRAGRVGPDGRDLGEAPALKAASADIAAGEAARPGAGRNLYPFDEDERMGEGAGPRKSVSWTRIVAATRHRPSATEAASHLSDPRIALEPFPSLRRPMPARIRFLSSGQMAIHKRQTQELAPLAGGDRGMSPGGSSRRRGTFARVARARTGTARRPCPISARILRLPQGSSTISQTSPGAGAPIGYKLHSV